MTHTITRQASEVAEALWMPVETFLTHPDVSPFNRHVVATAVATDGLHLTTVDAYNATPQRQQKIELFLPTTPP